MTTNNTPAATAKRRRLAAAGTLLTASATIAFAGLGLAAPANAADTYVAIAWSVDTGASGVANNQPTQDAANNAAMRMCRFSEPKNQAFGANCAIAVAGKDECVALATLAPQPDGLKFPTAVGQGPTLDDAQQQAVGFDGTLKVSRCSNGTGGVTPPPPPGQVAPPIQTGPGQQAH
jgi:Domain of unknown function (DUF4189)